MRGLLVIIAGLGFPAALLCVAATVAAESTDRPAAATQLGYLCRAEDAALPASPPDPDPDGCYLLRPGSDVRPTRIPTRDPRVLPPILMSPGGDLLSYFAWREVSCDPAYSLRVHFAVVVDTTGDEVAVLPGAWSVAWSPGGDSLAVVYGHELPNGGYAADSVGVLDVRARQGTTLPLQAAHVGWRDSRTIVLHSTRIQELDLVRGETRTTRHRGWVLSPDARYSIAIDPGGGTPFAVGDAAGKDLTPRILALIGDTGIGTTVPPFWVEGQSSGHLLCIPTVRRGPEDRGTAMPGTGRTSGRVLLVDVMQGRIVRSLDGIGIAPAADRRAIAVCRGGVLAFEDL